MIRKYAEIFCWKNVSSFCSAKATHIFSAKNIRILCIESTKTVNEMTLNELVKLTTLWTTGPWYFLSFSTQKIIQVISRQQKINNKRLYANECCTVTSWILSPVEFGCWTSGSTIEKASHPFEYQWNPSTARCLQKQKQNGRPCTKCYHNMSGRAKTDSYRCFVCVEVLQPSQSNQWSHI